MTRPSPTLDRERPAPVIPKPTTPAAEAQPAVDEPRATVLPEQPAIEVEPVAMSSPAPALDEPPAALPTTPPGPAEESVAAPDKFEASQPRSAVAGESTWARLANDVMAAAELAEELERDLEAVRRELADVRKAQRRAEQERDEAVEARFTASTVLEAVELAAACFPERLVVLPSVHASAGASPFRDPARIFEVLALLAMFGRHDGDLEAALQKVTGAGARWRPRDSAETSGRFGGHRTWAGSDGHRRLFRRHITLGHGVDAQRCAQIYYDVASDGRIELAWVGEHRPTVSEDA